MAEVTQYPMRSGRVVGENGDVYNVAEMLAEMGGAEPLEGVNAEVTQYPMRGGRVVGENGNVYNEAELLAGVAEKLDETEGSVSELEAELSELGLTVQDGKLCQTYNV